jgi:hypothetical protein
MSFIQRELDRLHSALLDHPGGNSYERLYAAQQALAWATDPSAFAAPSKLIMGTQEDSEDCSAHLRQPQSSGICS